MSEQRHPLKADLILVGATLVAAAGWIFSKESLAGLPPLLFVGVRFLLAGVVLLAFSWRQPARSRRLARLPAHRGPVHLRHDAVDQGPGARQPSR